MKSILKGGIAALMAVGLLAAPHVRADDWLKAETAHFTIYSNASDKTTRTYAKKLEAFRTLTNMLLGASDGGAQARFTLYMLSKDDQMLLVRPEFARQVGGVYFNCAEGTQAYAAVQNGRGGDQDWNLVVLFHEYSHYVMFQHARTYYPAWYVEGFAEYLSTADPEKGTITVGEMSQGRSYTLAEDRWISFNKVLDPDFGFAGDKTNDRWEIESFYAQSWLLTHYMLSDNTRAQALNSYFARLRNGEAPVPAFEAATGIKLTALKSILQRYGEKTFYLKVPVPDYPDDQLAVSHIPVSDADYLLDASLLSTCPGMDQGKAILARLQARLTPQASPELRLAVGRGQIMYGDAHAAETDLKALTDSRPDNFDASYLLGRAYLKEAEGASGETSNALTDQARAAFVSAYRLKKLDAPNLFFLARSFSSKPGFPDMNVVNAANGAHVLAPGVLDYAGLAAFADLANDRRDEAVAALEPFVGDPHNRDQAERIKKTIDAIKSGKPTAEVMKLMNSSPPSTEATASK